MAGLLEKKFLAGTESRTAEYPETVAVMRSFIEGKGGVVRFDEYMAEHLFGEQGYYSKRVDIRKVGGDFGTTALEPEFAKLLHAFFRDNKLSGRDFLELGGGEGTFKRNYLELCPETRYLSVDISKKLANLQKKSGENFNSQTLVADSTVLPLKDSSVEGIIFSNELLDALPCRMFRISIESGNVRINQEGFARLEGEGLNIGLGDAQRDDFLTEYEYFLNEIQPRRDMEDGDYICISPKIKTLLAEIDRVLKKGSVFLFDYGFAQGYVTMGRSRQELPYFAGNYTVDALNRIEARPYETDITYQIDFDYCKWIMNRINPALRSTVDPRHHLMRTILRENPDFAPLKSRIDETSREGVLIISK